MKPIPSLKFLRTISFGMLAFGIAGCTKEDPEVKIIEAPEIDVTEAVEKKVVVATEPSILYFLREFCESEDMVLIQDVASNSEAPADFIFVTDRSKVPSPPSSPSPLQGNVIDISATHPAALAAYQGAEVLDREHLQAVAEGTAEAVSAHLITDEAGKERVAQRLAALTARISEAKPPRATDLRPFVFAAPSLTDWVAATGMPGTFLEVDPLSDKQTIQALLKPLKSATPDFILWSKDPPAGARDAFSDQDISSLVVKTEAGPGEDPIECLRANLESLSKLQDPYVAVILPFLDQHCIECHDADTAEGEVVFDLYPTRVEAVMHPELWEEAVDLIEMGDMPPRKKPEPADSEKEAFIAWVENLSSEWDAGAMGDDPGQVTLRRLNKNEYNYTIRDLFGLKIRPADNFPQDAGGEAGFDNNADALFLPPLLMENYVESAGLIVEAIYGDRDILARYLFERPRSMPEAEPAARKILNFWASRVYRRPVEKEELDQLVAIYQSSMEKENHFATAMQMPLVTILISPNFLFRPETSHPEKDLYKISDFDLASRLSYFLWSSMPDIELFRLAQKNELSKPGVLEKQVIRMLQDQKSTTLGMHLGGQWFKWEDLRTTANPDTTKFPDFTFDLRVSMYRESSKFFHDLVQRNGSILDLIDSDYTFVDERLAEFYGIPGVTGNRLQKVQIEDPNRGGILGMASVLTATSGPMRTSPSVRGDWVLTELLGTPTPAPPMNVDQLPEDDRNLGGLSVRESLEQHRSNPSCAGCHGVIDPLGFGLENFDPIGRWRDINNGHPIDSKGELVDGRNFNNPSELKEILMEDKDLFVRSMVRKVLAYALGRELTPYDRHTIAQITEKVIEDDYRMHRVFLEITHSYPFLNRKSDHHEPQPLSQL